MYIHTKKRCIRLVCYLRQVGYSDLISEDLLSYSRAVSAVEVAFEKPRFLGFHKPKNQLSPNFRFLGFLGFHKPKNQLSPNFRFLGFLFLKTIIFSCIITY